MAHVILDSGGREIGRAGTLARAHRLSRRVGNGGDAVVREHGPCSVVWVVEVGMDYEGTFLTEVFEDRLDAERYARKKLRARATYADDDDDVRDPGDDAYLSAPRTRDATRYNEGSYWATVTRAAVRRS